MTPLDFSTLSDAQINAAVVEAEGWTKKRAMLGDEKEGHYEGDVWIKPNGHQYKEPPPYATSCDECVRLLAQYHTVTIERGLLCDDWLVQIWRECPGSGPESGNPEPPHIDISWEGKAPIFPRAACLAWGRAKGVFSYESTT
jgi:hypothetical protein